MAKLCFVIPLLALGFQLSACGDSAAEGGSGGEAGAALGGSNSDGGSNASGGANAGGANAGGAPNGGNDVGGAGGEGGAAPLAFLDAYPLQSTYPEGAAFDLASHSFYVGSLESGSVYAIDVETGVETEVFTETAAGTWFTLGMAVDAAGRKLWVCAADQDSDPYYGELWTFDLDTGERTKIVPLTNSGENAWCEDVAVDSAGNAFATDRENPNIYRVGANDTVPSLFATDPELGSSFIGQNGIIVLPGDEALIAAVHFPARLNRIEIPSGVVTPITISGDFADATIGSGADGMVLVEGVLYVVFDGELVKVEPTLADWTAVTATEAELTSGLTDVVSTPNGLYLANGQAIGFVFGQEPTPFSLVRFTGSF